MLKPFLKKYKAKKKKKDMERIIEKNRMKSDQSKTITSLGQTWKHVPLHPPSSGQVVLDHFEM